MAIQYMIHLITIILLFTQSNAQLLPAGDAPTECLTDRAYSVRFGDTCSRIADAYGFPRGSLIFLNEIHPDCADLRVGQVLCLPQPCRLFRVVRGTSCLEIAEYNRISVEDLIAWNEYLGINCNNLMAGDNVCVAELGASPSPTQTFSTVTTMMPRTDGGYATAIVAPPGPVPRGTTPNCGEYYKVKRGDYCDSIADRFSIDLELFEAINPAINEECTNLVPGLYYCVSPTRDWNATVTTTLTSTYATAPGPMPSGTTDQCYEWYIARTGDTCDMISSIYGVSVEDIRFWNPSLNEDCSNLRSGRAYCVDGEPVPDASPASGLTETTAVSSGENRENWWE